MQSTYSDEWDLELSRQHEGAITEVPDRMNPHEIRQFKDAMRGVLAEIDSKYGTDLAREFRKEIIKQRKLGKGTGLFQ